MRFRLLDEFASTPLPSGQQRPYCSKTGLSHVIFDLTTVFLVKFYPDLTSTSPDLVIFPGSYLSTFGPYLQGKILQPAAFCLMATARHRVRMASIRSALDAVRAHQRQFTSGCGMVVSGGATMPDTKLNSDISAIANERSDNYALTLPLPTSPSSAPTVRHLVVCDGAIAPPPPRTIPSADDHALGVSFGVPPRRIFHFPPPYPYPIDAFAMVVPSHFWLWHRTGVG